MIPGFATADGTAAFARSHPDLAFKPLGTTELVVSTAGFGGYRISVGVPAHAAALEKALDGGINLIDTSANYADGGSERLVGEILHKLIDAGRIRRAQVVVVSKGGYIQGANDVLRRQRETEGRPFEEVVAYADGLRHCIHPDYLEDQIGRSLERLGLETIDGYLLHNPEYYLGWAWKQKQDAKSAREEYYRRIKSACNHLELEVARGRIRFYGISSNTFPAPSDDPEFTSLHRVLEIVRSLSDDHYFKLIQMPFNLLEAGAILEKNQPDGRTVLALAHANQLGVLINRPLNAFTRKRMVRLASIQVRGRMDYQAIIQRIKELAASETRLWRKILPGLDTIPNGIKVRIKQQACFAESLKHHWRSFGSYERWREAKDGIFVPRVQGVMNYLQPLSEDNPDLTAWIKAHNKILDQAFVAVASIYTDDAVALEKKIVAAVNRADEDWSCPGTLSRKAIHALASTTGVSAVLVGMRQKTYVEEVLREMSRAHPQTERVDSWRRLHDGLATVFKE